MSPSAARSRILSLRSNFRRLCGKMKYPQTGVAIRAALESNSAAHERTNTFHDHSLRRRDGKVVMAGDGQVTLGQEVLKASAKKLRRLYNDKILAGFAGSTADAFALFARFEAKLEQFNGNLPRAVVELAKEWRTDRVLRHLEALLLVADTTEHLYRQRQWRCDRAG